MPMMFSPLGEVLDIPDVAIHAMVALGWEVQGDAGRHAAPEDTDADVPDPVDDADALEDTADQEPAKPARRSRSKAKTEE